MEIPFEEFTVSPINMPDYGSSGLRANGSSDLQDNPANRVINFLSMGSGSSGNCCYVGTRSGGFLVDAGVRADFVESSLRSNGVRMESVKGIILTHDHSDHVKYAYTLLRTHRHIRLFCTNRVINGLLRRHGISKRIKDYHVPIFKEIPFKIGETEITAFDVPHDGTDNMGFSINYDNRNFVIATDLGAITERARYYMSRANYLVIEANYDSDMLTYGPYPEYLKARIRTDHGHLDNRVTADFLKDIWHSGLKYIFLCHLSKDNNTPMKALKEVRQRLEERGLTVGDCKDTIYDRQTDVQLMALPRFDTSRWFVFHPGLNTKF